MTSAARPDYALMNQLLFEGKHEAVKQMTEQALADGRPAMEVLEEGLIAGMKVVGEDFKYNRVFVPEVLLAARAMKAGMAVLKPLLTERKDAARKASAEASASFGNNVTVPGARPFDSSMPALAQTQPGPVSQMRCPSAIRTMRVVSRRITSTRRASLASSPAICAAKGDGSTPASSTTRPSAFDTTF